MHERSSPTYISLDSSTVSLSTEAGTVRLQNSPFVSHYASHSTNQQKESLQKPSGSSSTREARILTQPLGIWNTLPQWRVLFSSTRRQNWNTAQEDGLSKLTNNWLSRDPRNPTSRHRGGMKEQKGMYNVTLTLAMTIRKRFESWSQNVRKLFAN